MSAPKLPATATLMDPDNLDRWVEFDSPFEVLRHGYVIQRHDVLGATYLDDHLDSSKWETWSQGYTGQDSYNGPVMHNSEFLGGRMAQDLLDEPGVYVLTAAEWSPDEDDENGDTDLYAEGWVIARLKDDE